MSEDTSSSSSSNSNSTNPGWAGETGEFGHLSEIDIRGTTYVGEQPKGGWPAGGINAYPYQIAEKAPEAPLFAGAHAERLEKILARYPQKRAALLPVLNLAQEIRGHLSPETMAEVAATLDVAPAAVRGVATFYSMYNRAPVGRYLIQICTNIACGVCGGDDVLEAFLEHVGADVGETSEDGLFTVLEVECLGACGFPTVVQINNRYFENVEPADVPAILERLTEHGVDPKGGGNRGGPAREVKAMGDVAAQGSNSNSTSNSRSMGGEG